MSISSLFRRQDNKYRLDIETADSNALLACALNVDELYFFHSLLFNLFQTPAIDDSSPVAISSIESQPHSRSKSQVKKRNNLREWVHSLRKIPITLGVAFPGVIIVIKRQNTFVQLSLSSIACNGIILVDLMDGCSLKNTFTLQTIIHIKDHFHKTHEAQACTVRFTLTPSMNCTLSMTPIHWNLQITAVSLLLDFCSFFSLLPSSSSSILLEKHVVFGKQSRKEYFLQEEISRMKIVSVSEARAPYITASF